MPDKKLKNPLSFFPSLDIKYVPYTPRHPNDPKGIADGLLKFISGLLIGLIRNPQILCYLLFLFFIPLAYATTPSASSRNKPNGPSDQIDLYPSNMGATCAIDPSPTFDTHSKIDTQRDAARQRVYVFDRESNSYVELSTKKSNTPPKTEYELMSPEEKLRDEHCSSLLRDAEKYLEQEPLKAKPLYLEFVDSVCPKKNTREISRRYKENCSQVFTNLGGISFYEGKMSEAKKYLALAEELGNQDATELLKEYAEHFSPKSNPQSNNYNGIKNLLWIMPILTLGLFGIKKFIDRTRNKKQVEEPPKEYKKKRHKKK